MKAKKSLGQHFLKSEKALNTIVDTGEISPTDTILEIGPGTGTLTDKLLVASGLVLAIEKDDELFEKLKIKYQNEVENKKLILIHDDILNFEFESHKLATNTYKLIANIPYNITGAIIKKFLSADHQPKKIVLLVQKEVARRIVAQDEKESILSISVKAYGVPKYIETVKAGSFAPMPKVDSAIISIENISKDFFKNFSEKEFFDLVRAGFKSKRKKLSSNLAEIIPKVEVMKAFESINLDTNSRAEDINIQIWEKLARFV